VDNETDPGSRALQPVNPTVLSGCGEFDRAQVLLRDQREDEALDHFEVALEVSTDPILRASAAAHVAGLLLGFGRPWEVASFATQVREISGERALGDALEAAACVQLGDFRGALELVGDRGPVPEPHDPWFPLDTATVLSTRLRALVLAARADEAIEQLEAALAADAGARALWEVAVHLVATGVVTAEKLTDLVPDERVVDVFGWITGSDPRALDALAEALWQRTPGDARVLAGIVFSAWELPLERCAVWTGRLLDAGVTNRVPLLERAEIVRVSAADRVRAALVGSSVDEPRARRALELAVDQLRESELADLLDECIDAECGLGDSFVVAAATDTRRCLCVCARLAQRGHAHEALAVLTAGLMLPSADVLQPEEFDELLPEPIRSAMAGVAAAAGDPEVAAILRSVPSRG
jgi:hypothetical protein